MLHHDGVHTAKQRDIARRFVSHVRGGGIRG